jgi:hypothetical protein
MIRSELYAALYTFIALFFVLIRLGYAEPFYYFKRVLVDDTFIRLYEKGLKRWRNALILLTIASALVYAVFLTQLSEIRTVPLFNFLNASIAVSALLFLKMGVRKALAFAHNDSAFFEMAQIYALTYFACEALMVFALGILLSVYPEQSLLFEYVVVSLILVLQTKCYYGVIKHLIRRKSERLVLFIFYLCALEIAPVVVVYTLSI